MTQTPRERARDMLVEAAEREMPCSCNYIHPRLIDPSCRHDDRDRAIDAILDLFDVEEQEGVDMISVIEPREDWHHVECCDPVVADRIVLSEKKWRMRDRDQSE